MPDDIHPSDEGAQRAADVGEDYHQQNMGDFVTPKTFEGVNIFGDIFKVLNIRFFDKSLR